MGGRVVPFLLSALFWALLVNPAAAAPITFNFVGTWTTLPADVQLWLPDLDLDTPFLGTLQTEEIGDPMSGLTTFARVEMTAGTHQFVTNHALAFQTSDGLWHADGYSSTSSVSGALMPLPLDAFRVTWAADGTGSVLFSGLGFGVQPGGTRLIGSGTFTPAPEPATLVLCLLGGGSLLARRRFRRP
jgi:hypothetical protein